jgi:hypothetical protein
MQSKFNMTLVFAVGFLLGLAAAGLAIHHCFNRTCSNSSDADYLLKRLSSKLDLTAEQKTRVAALLKEEMPKAEALHQETRVKFKALADSFNSRLKPLLSGAQQQKLDAMAARWNERGQKRGRFFGCGDNGPFPYSSPVPASVK